MPIIKYKNKVVHFAHVPKCAGTSIERYVRLINGAELAFVDMHFVSHPPKHGWNTSSPQHIDGGSFGRLFPRSFFDGFFVVVREPLARVISAYKFNRYKEAKIQDGQSLDQFIKESLKENVEKVGWLDNHFLPQNRFLYPKAGYRVFKLERGGLDPVKKYIDRELIGSEITIKMPEYNVAKQRTPVDSDQLKISQASVEILNDIYEVDFERFKYPLIKSPE